jgi:hypothetical protein
MSFWCSDLIMLFSLILVKKPLSRWSTDDLHRFLRDLAKMPIMALVAKDAHMNGLQFARLQRKELEAHGVKVCH